MNKPIVGEIFQERYLITAEIGAGGMGIVYKAKQLDADREVAIKLLRQTELDTDDLSRFVREFKLLSGLSHQHIVQVYGMAVDDHSFPYAICEFLEGTNLRLLLSKVGAMDWQRTLGIVLQISDALKYTHGNNIIYRDLKPENIMLVDRPAPDYVKLIDFGLSRLCDFAHGDSQRLTKDGQLVGTPAYMAPEQIHDSQQVDTRVDIYGLGCLVFEMLAGEPLFTADNPIGIMYKHCNEDPSARFGHIRVPVPARLLDVLTLMLAKRPLDRYQTMVEVENELSDILSSPGRLCQFSSAQRLDGMSVPVEITLDQAARRTQILQLRTRKLLLCGLVLFGLLASSTLIVHFYQSNALKKTDVFIKQFSKSDLGKLSLTQLTNKAGKLHDEAKYADECACWEKALKIVQSRKQRLLMLGQASSCALLAGKAHPNRDTATQFYEKSLAWAEQGLVAAAKEKDKWSYVFLCGTKQRTLALMHRTAELLKFSDSVIEGSSSFDEYSKLSLLNQLMEITYMDAKPAEAETLLKKAIAETKSMAPTGETYGRLLQTQLVLSTIYKRRGLNKKATKLVVETGNELNQDQTIKVDARVDILGNILNILGNLTSTSTRLEANIARDIALKDMQNHKEIYHNELSASTRALILIGRSFYDDDNYAAAFSKYEEAWRNAERSQCSQTMRREILTELIRCGGLIHDLAKVKLYKNELDKSFGRELINVN